MPKMLFSLLLLWLVGFIPNVRDLFFHLTTQSYFSFRYNCEGLRSVAFINFLTLAVM